MQESRQSQPQQESLPALSEGTAVEAEVRQGEVRSYVIALPARRYGRLSIERAGVAIEARLTGPDGRVLIEAPMSNQRSLMLSLPAVSSGTYQLRVRMLEKSPEAGHYKVMLQGVREASETDVKRSLAEKSFIEGEQLRARWTINSFRQALERFEAARAAWHKLGDAVDEIKALKNIGDVYFTISEYQKALGYYSQALKLSRETHDRAGEIEAVNALGYVYIYLGDNKNAHEYCNRGLALSLEAGDRLGQAQALNNLGEVAYMMGELPKARDTFFAQAFNLWTQLGDHRGQALVLINLGYIHYDLGDLQKARDVFERALSLWRMSDERRGQALALSQLAGIASVSGDKQAALDLFNEALRIFREIGDRNGEAATLNGISHFYLVLGQEQQALDSYTRAVELYKEAGNRNYEGLSIGLIADVYQKLGERQKALEHYQRALTILREVGDPWNEAYMLQHLADVYRSSGDTTNAFQLYNLALPLSRKLENKRLEAYILGGLGQLYELSGERRKALEYYQQALSLNQLVMDREGEMATIYDIARVERDQGNLAAALALMEGTIKEIESRRTKIGSEDLRTSYFASVHQNYDLYIDLLMQIDKQTPSQSFAERALHSSESARSRTLLEILNEARTGIHHDADMALLDKERSLQRLLNLKAENQVRLLSGRHTATQAQAAAKELREITADLDYARAQIRVKNPHYAALTQPQPLSLSEIQRQVLDENTLLLEYFLGEKRSYLWTVTPIGINSYELPPGEVIEKPVRQLYSLLTARQRLSKEGMEQYQARVAAADSQYWKQAQSLSNILLGPAADELKNKRLLIVADGPLQYIPFSALTVPALEERGGGRKISGKPPEMSEPVPLILDHEIVSLPSASVLALLRREIASRAAAPKEVAVLADPVFEADDPRLKISLNRQAASPPKQQSGVSYLDRSLRDVGGPSQLGLPRLLGSREEAEVIISLASARKTMKALGFEASRATASSSELSKYRMVHFATHGIFNDVHPELSGIVLSLFDAHAKAQDGFLRLHDIYNLKLPAELVVLSACNSGLGKEIKGEGLVGLTRGFMYAGAARVVASLWKVDDSATKELMSIFYQGILKDNKSPAAALRTAQIKIWQHKQWSAPYYWAAFELHGEWK
ncbi:MAG TPA: CHAT domain-containing protein [Pyrinomonadaceae bacterium]